MKWYQVDSDTPNDPKIKRLLETSRGPEAATLIGHLFLLWCFVANHGHGDPGHGITADGEPLDLSDMAYECRFQGDHDLRVFLDRLASLKLIDPARWADGFVFLPAMKKRADTYARSKGRGPAGGSRANAGESGGTTTRITPDQPLQDTTRQDTTNPEDQNLRGSADPPDLLADAGATSVDALVRLWNDTRKPGPSIGKISPQRRAGFGRALKAQPDLAEWRTAILWLNGQRWCNGQGSGDHPNWRATLDWLAKPGKLAEYLDKARGDRPASPDGTVGRNAAKGRTGYRPGQFAEALKSDDAIH